MYYSTCGVLDSVHCSPSCDHLRLSVATPQLCYLSLTIKINPEIDRGADFDLLENYIFPGQQEDIGGELVLILTFIKISFACSCFINMICNLSNDLRAMQEAESHISISAAASSFFRENSIWSV